MLIFCVSVDFLVLPIRSTLAIVTVYIYNEVVGLKHRENTRPGGEKTGGSSMKVRNISPQLCGKYLARGEIYLALTGPWRLAGNLANSSQAGGGSYDYLWGGEILLPARAFWGDARKGLCVH